MCQLVTGTHPMWAITFFVITPTPPRSSTVRGHSVIKSQAGAWFDRAAMRCEIRLPSGTRGANAIHTQAAERVCTATCAPVRDARGRWARVVAQVERRGPREQRPRGPPAGAGKSSKPKEHKGHCSGHERRRAATATTTTLTLQGGGPLAWQVVACTALILP